MKVDEVPQDNSSSIHKAMYAVDHNGQYTTIESNGWQAENTATRLAIADFERERAAAHARCVAGECAPLEYHMYAQRMDLATLADAAGIARWRLRRHLRPAVFTRLPERLLARYAETLQMPITELARLPAAPPQ